MRYHKAKYRGYATVMAMMFLTIGATLSAWLFSMLFTGTAIARNDTASSRAQTAAESGLAYLRYMVTSTTSSTRIQGQTDAQLMDSLLAALNGKLASGITKTTDATGIAQLSIASTTLTDGSSFTGIIAFSKINPHTFSLQVTGSYGVAVRTVGMELDKQLNSLPTALTYALVAKGGITLPSNPNAGIAEYVPGKGADTTNMGTDQLYAAATSTGNADVLLFNNTPAPSSTITFPTFPSSLYSTLNSLVDAGLSKASGNNWNNVYIPANTNPTLPTTVNGVVYVKWPNNISFNNTTVNGVIIYEPAPAGSTTTSTITIVRTASMTFNPPKSTDTSYANLLGNANAAAVVGWSLIAPNAAVTLENGNTSQVKTYNGNWDVNSIYGTGKGSGDANTMVFNNASVIVETTANLGGNRIFSMNAPGLNGNGNSGSGYALNLITSTYWEK